MKRGGAWGALVTLGLGLAGIGGCPEEEYCLYSAYASGLEACELVAIDTTTLRFDGAEVRACIRDHCVVLNGPAYNAPRSASWAYAGEDDDVFHAAVILSALDDSTLQHTFFMQVFPHFVSPGDVYRVEVDSAEGERIFEAEFPVELYEVRGLRWNCGGPNLAFWSSQLDCDAADE